ncbi:hypothetical protein D9M71_86210 [compost metagenome]
MQVALQGFQFEAVVDVEHPALQGTRRAFEDVEAFLEENVHQFLVVLRRQVVDAGDRLRRRGFRHRQFFRHRSLLRNSFRLQIGIDHRRFAEGADRLDQLARIGQRRAAAKLFDLRRQAVMTTLQQPGEGRRYAMALLGEAFVERFELMGQVADLADVGHPRTALEGVQVALQGMQGGGGFRRTQPLLQGLAGAFQQIHRLVEEDRHHFVVDRRRLLQRSQLLAPREGPDQHVVLGGQGGIRTQRPGQAVRQVLAGGVPRQQEQFLVLGREILRGEAVQVEEVLFLQRGQPAALQQLAQRLYLLRPRRDLQRRGHLVHHADQGFVGLLGNAEEGLVHRQLPVAHGLVDCLQGLAQLGHLRQLGHPRAAAEGRQFVEQRAQLREFPRMFAPAAEQVFGIEQDVHAFGEEHADHLRIAAFAPFVAALLLSRFLAFQLQKGDLLQQRFAALDRRQRPAAEQLFETAAEQPRGIAQQLGLAQVDLQQVGLEVLDQPLQRRGHFGDRQYPRHVRTALEGVQGALQVVGHRLRQFALAVGEEGVEGFQMGFRLVAEDLQQLRVEPFVEDQLRRGLREGRRLHRRRCLRQLPAGQGVGAGGQGVHVVALALGAGGEFRHQFRHQRHGAFHRLVDCRTRRDAAVEHAVEQVLDGPGQFADDQGADHAAAALEGMEGAAHLGERLARLAVGQPQR